MTDPFYNPLITVLMGYIAINSEEISIKKFFKVVILFIFFINFSFYIKLGLLMFYLFVFEKNNIILSLIRVMLMFELFVMNNVSSNDVFLVSSGLLLITELISDYIPKKEWDCFSIIKYIMIGSVIGFVSSSQFVIFSLLLILFVELLVSKKPGLLSLVALLSFVGIEQNNPMYFLPIISLGVLVFPKVEIKKDILKDNIGMTLIIFFTFIIGLEILILENNLLIKLPILAVMYMLMKLLAQRENYITKNVNNYITSFVLALFTIMAIV